VQGVVKQSSGFSFKNGEAGVPARHTCRIIAPVAAVFFARIGGALPLNAVIGFAGLRASLTPEKL
jgi:hypothetical protein